jgi:hypothetical protein
MAPKRKTTDININIMTGRRTAKLPGRIKNTPSDFAVPVTSLSDSEEDYPVLTLPD